MRPFVEACGLTARCPSPAETSRRRLPLWSSFALVVGLLLGCSGQRASASGGRPEPARLLVARSAPEGSAESEQRPRAPEWREQVSEACQRGLVAELSSLPSELRLTLFVTPGLADVDELADALESMIRSYQSRVAPGHLAFERVEVTTEERQAQARNYGLTAQALAKQESGAVVLPESYFGLSLEYGGARDVLTSGLVDDVSEVPFWLRIRISALRARVEHRAHPVGFVVGTGGVELEQAYLLRPVGSGLLTLEQLAKRILSDYEVRPVSLDDASLADLDALVLTQPGRSLQDEELRRIDAFMMRGGKKLVVMASAVNAKDHDADLQGVLDRQGLDALLEAYGVVLHSDLVLDPDACVSWPVIHGDGSEGVYTQPSIPIVAEQRLDSEQPPFVGLRALPFPYASSLTLARDRQPGATFRVLAQTSGAAVGVHSEYWVPLADPRADGPHAQRVLAASIEGELRSAFDDRRAPARVLVLSSSQFLTNPLARAGNGPVLGGAFAAFGAIGGDARLQALSQRYWNEEIPRAWLALRDALDWGESSPELASCTALLQPSTE